MCLYMMEDMIHILVLFQLSNTDAMFSISVYNVDDKLLMGAANDQ